MHSCLVSGLLPSSEDKALETYLDQAAYHSQSSWQRVYCKTDKIDDAKTVRSPHHWHCRAWHWIDIAARRLEPNRSIARLDFGHPDLESSSGLLASSC